MQEVDFGDGPSHRVQLQPLSAPTATQSISATQTVANLAVTPSATTTIDKLATPGTGLSASGCSVVVFSFPVVFV